MATAIERLNWENIKIFLAIARGGSLRRAAEQLRINHATMARHLNTLEDQVGARLFDRTKSGLDLTAIGHRLLPFAQNVETEIAAASRVVTGHDQKLEGVVHLSLPPSMVLSPISQYLADFAIKYPDIEVALDLTNTIAQLNKREADVSLRYAQEVTDDVVGRRLVKCSKAIYCSPEYAKKMVDNHGEGLHWIGWAEEEGAKTTAWTEKSAFPKAQLKYRANEAVPQLTLASSGLGLAMLPCFIADQFPGLERAPFSTALPDRSIWLLLHSDLKSTGRIRAFVDYIADRILADRALFRGEN
ncbi:LysR family transcriptional regulator [Maritalea sp.]|jgi:DNA-binding transcriptional LysR family regulator|uniref:LysR family transcriptional regulator n=1 Tax=Maritalea sp. TaxID=2003361 RepID=UPI0039E417F6